MLLIELGFIFQEIFSQRLLSDSIVTTVECVSFSYCIEGRKISTSHCQSNSYCDSCRWNLWSWTPVCYAVSLKGNMTNSHLPFLFFFKFFFLFFYYNYYYFHFHSSKNCNYTTPSMTQQSYLNSGKWIFFQAKTTKNSTTSAKPAKTNSENVLSVFNHH